MKNQPNVQGNGIPTVCRTGLHLCLAMLSVPGLLLVGLSGQNLHAAGREPSSAEQRLVAESLIAAEVLARAPPELLGVSELQRSLGRDLNDIHAWVHDNTRHVAYEGALRGATGTLHSRQGNSLDRSLLLAALFRLAGADVRLASATEPVDVIRRLQQQALRRETLPPIEDLTLTASLLSRATDESTIEAEGRLRSMREGRAAYLQEIEARTEALGASLASELPDAPGEEAGLQPEERVHWWVLASTGEAGWTPFDPQQADFATEELLSAMTEVDIDALPASLLHTVTLRIDVDIDGEGEEGGTHTLLEHRFRPAIDGHTLGMLTFAPHPAAATGDFVSSLNGDLDGFLRTTLRQQTTWSPVILMNDGSMITERAVTLDGRILDQPPAMLAQTADKAREATGVLGGLGNASGEGDEAPGKHRLTRISAQWQTDTPGASAGDTRRVIYDRERHGEDLLDLATALSSRNTFLLQAADVPQSLATLEHARRVKRMELPLRYLQAQVDRDAMPDDQALASLFARLYSVPQVPLAFAAQRDLGRYRQYMASIDILQYFDEMYWEDDEARFRSGLDIVSLSSRTRTARHEPREAMTLQRLASLHTAIVEAGFLEGATDSALDYLTSAEASTLERVTDASQLQSIGNRQLRGDLTSDLQDGSWLLLPDMVAPAAWWRVSPDTGSLVANRWIDGTTRGATSTETTVKLWHTLEVMIALADFAKNTVACKESSSPGGCVLCVGIKLVLSLGSIGNHAQADPVGAAGDVVGLAC